MDDMLTPEVDVDAVEADAARCGVSTETLRKIRAAHIRLPTSNTDTAPDEHTHSDSPDARWQCQPCGQPCEPDENRCDCCEERDYREWLATEDG